jgi:hypothetical protein
MFQYIKNPRYIIATQANLKEKMIYLLKSWGAVMAINVIILIIIFTCNFFITKYLHQPSILHQSNSLTYIKTKYKRWAWLFVVLLGPFLEESMFRLLLNFKTRSVAISSALLLYMLVEGHLFQFNFFNITYYVKLLSAIAVGLFAAKFFTQPLLDKIKTKYFPVFFYGMAALFALGHISNYTPLNYKVIYMYPILVLPQFFEGLFISNIRMKYGFMWGFFLHGLINLPTAIVFLLN